MVRCDYKFQFRLKNHITHSFRLRATRFLRVSRFRVVKDSFVEFVQSILVL